MQIIGIAKFKATCLAVLERVRTTGEPVLVTRRGEPVAEIVPPSHDPDGERRLGVMAGTIRVVGDIVSPASGETEWEALRG